MMNAIDDCSTLEKKPEKTALAVISKNTHPVGHYTPTKKERLIISEATGIPAHEIHSVNTIKPHHAIKIAHKVVSNSLRDGHNTLLHHPRFI